jgi:type IV secretion system protein VirD4
MKIKAGLALATLLLALIAGVYLAGVLVPMLLKVQVTTPWYETWWSYFRVLDLPQVKPHAARIKLATLLGFGLPALTLLPLTFVALKPRPKPLHGDARFASTGDLAQKQMFKPHDNGIVVGKMGGKLIRLPGQQFVILAAPTRSGKGVGLVIPNLLDYQESMVVLDIKQENFDLTSGWRASQGQEIYLFNPFAEDRRTHRWNPLTYVSRDPAFRVSDLSSIAAMLYPDGADDQKFWVSQARNAFLAFSLYLFEERESRRSEGFPPSQAAYPTLGAIFRLSSGDGTDLKQYLRERGDKPFLGHNARTAFNNLLSQAPETFASIMGTFKEPLNAWINPVLDAATSGDDFLLTDVRRKRMTIYIGIQPNKLAESRLIVNLFFSQLINQNTRELPQNNPELKHQCLLLMDEFTSIGKVEIIASSVAYMAGYNIRLMPIIQSMAQLDATYGKDVSRTMITNHALQIVFAPREQQDANDYSEMLGYTTVRKKNRSRSYGQHGNYTLSENEERRALMLPQELKAMGFDTQVFFYEGIPHPVKCEKIKYYKDSYFTRRLLPKTGVPALQIGMPQNGDADMNKTLQTVTAATGLALAACASPSGSASNDQSRISPKAQAVLARSAEPEAARATADASSETASNPAELLAQKLLKLVGGLKTKEEFTVDLVNQALGIEMKELHKIPGWFELEEGLDDKWRYRITFRTNPKRGSVRMSIGIAERNRGNPLPLTKVCLEFERFAAELERLGYTRQPMRAGLYGEPGIATGDWRFYRRKPDHEYDEGDVASEHLFPLAGAGPVDVLIDQPFDELMTTEGEYSGGRKCIVNLTIETTENAS